MPCQMQGEDPALCPNAWVNNGKMDRSPGKMPPAGGKKMRRGQDVSRRHPVREIDDTRIRGNRQDRPLHQADILVGSAEIRGQGYSADHSIPVRLTKTATLMHCALQLSAVVVSHILASDFYEAIIIPVPHGSHSPLSTLYCAV